MIYKKIRTQGHPSNWSCRNNWTGRECSEERLDRLSPPCQTLLQHPVSCSPSPWHAPRRNETTDLGLMSPGAHPALLQLKKNPPQVVQETQTSIYNFLTAWIAQSLKIPVKSAFPPFSPNDKTCGSSGWAISPPDPEPVLETPSLLTPPFQHPQLPNLPPHPTTCPRLSSIHECSSTSPDLEDNERHQRKPSKWQAWVIEEAGTLAKPTAGLPRNSIWCRCKEGVFLVCFFFSSDSLKYVFCKTN